MVANFGRRFEELSQQAKTIEASKSFQDPGTGFSGYNVDSDHFLNWMVKVRHLIVTVCGEASQHFKKLLETEKPSFYTTSHEMFRRSLAVLLAAKEDFHGGYLNSVRNLVQADVFESELDQATELLNAGYEAAAAVICGVVLETTLRQLCGDHAVAISKLDKMNADLAKAGVFNKLVQKQITAWGDIRNSAAHGNSAGFTRDDVVAMIRDVERFVAEQLG